MREAELPFFNKLSFKFSIYLVVIILMLMTLFTIYLVNDFAETEAKIYQENFKKDLHLLANISSNYLWDFEFKDLKANAEYFFSRTRTC